MTMYLYRKVGQSVTLAAAIVVFSLALQAQFRAPQPERKTARAIGVLETFKNGSQRLIPVTFFYEHHFYDATFYRATPVPFTLYSETVYEVEQFGKSLGTFTVLNATQKADAWWGNGRFKTAPDAAALARKKALKPVVLEDPSKPMLHRRAGSEGDNPVAHSDTAATVSEAEDDPDRPKLQRRQGSGGDSSASAPAQSKPPAGAAPDSTSAKAAAGTQAGDTTDGSSAQDPDRPKLHRRDDSADSKSAPSAATGSMSTVSATPAKAALTPSGDPDHPILRRGKPVQVQSGRDLPEFINAEEHVTRQVAVSDAGPSEEQPVIYVCREEERRQLEASARELAQAELRRVAVPRGIVLPSPAKAHPAPAKSGSQTKPKLAPPALAPLNLDEEQFVPYDLDYNDYATVVFSARYVPEPSAQGAAGADTTAMATNPQGPHAKGKSWVVTVVARQDGDKLIKLYSVVSDPRELDLYPEVRLVDAVDPDGYGRYGLLFREQKRDGVSWLLGRVTGYELHTVIETAVR